MNEQFLAVVDSSENLLKWINAAPLADIIPLYDCLDQLSAKIKEVKTLADERVINEGEGTYISPLGTKIYKTVETKKTVRREETFDALSIGDQRELFSANCFKHGAVSTKLGEEFVTEERTDKVVVKAMTEKQAKFFDEMKFKKSLSTQSPVEKVAEVTVNNGGVF